eukprot:1906173-Pyramimonas_sp.AAC.1
MKDGWWDYRSRQAKLSWFNEPYPCPALPSALGARTKYSRPNLQVPSVVCRDLMLRMQTRWLRELASFICVASTALCWAPGHQQTGSVRNDVDPVRDESKKLRHTASACLVQQQALDGMGMMLFVGHGVHWSRICMHTQLRTHHELLCLATRMDKALFNKS